MSKGSVRKIDMLGRTVIPKEIRCRFEIKEGDRLGISLDSNTIHMSKALSGMNRPVDDLGRIVIPKEMRRSLGIKENDPVDIYVENDEICIRKEGCFICGSTVGLLDIDGVPICRAHAVAIAGKLEG